jgi:hypothetical protein
MDVRRQHRTNHDILCPVKALQSIINRILTDSKSSSSTTINFYRDPSSDKACYFSQADTIKTLRDTCRSLPDRHFGYSEKEIGSHSLRSGAAMALFRARVDKVRIMAIGRWHSDAFLRPNAPHWSEDLSNLMVEATTTTRLNGSERNDTATSTNQNNTNDRGLPASSATSSRNSIDTEVAFYHPATTHSDSDGYRHPDDPHRRNDPQSCTTRYFPPSSHGPSTRQYHPQPNLRKY